MTHDRDGFPDPDPRTPADWFAEPDLEERFRHDPAYIALRAVEAHRRPVRAPSRRVWVAAVVFGVVAVLVWRAG